MKMKFFAACVIVLSVLFSLVSGVISSAAAEPKEKILVVLSGVDYVSLNDGSTHETGFYLSELATPLRILASKGFEFEFANPTGRQAVMDKTSDALNYFKDEKDHAAAKELLNNKDFKAPKKLSSYGDDNLAGFAGIFLPGGHAPMEDLYRDADLGRILAYFHKAGKPTALICHAPVALLSAAPESGKDWIYKGYKMTMFSNEEEAQAEKALKLSAGFKFRIEDRLAGLGAVVNNAKPWQSNAVSDRELITGQNPMSDEKMTELFLDALGGKKK